MSLIADWTTEEMVCELEDRSNNNNPNLSWEKNKAFKKKKQRPPVTHGTISSSSIYKQFKCQKEREESGAGKKKKLEEIITENFPNLMKNINPQINKTKKNKQKQKPNYSYPGIY